MLREYITAEIPKKVNRIVNTKLRLEINCWRTVYSVRTILLLIIRQLRCKFVRRELLLVSIAQSTGISSCLLTPQSVPSTSPPRLVIEA